METILQHWQPEETRPGTDLTNASCLASSQQIWLPVSEVVLWFGLFARTVWGEQKVTVMGKYRSKPSQIESNAQPSLLPITPIIFFYSHTMYIEFQNISVNSVSPTALAILLGPSSCPTAAALFLAGSEVISEHLVELQFLHGTSRYFPKQL